MIKGLIILAILMGGLFLLTKKDASTTEDYTGPNLVNVTSKADFDSILASNHLVLVDIWAEWCPPCHVMKPVINNIAQTHPDVMVVKIDLDREQTVAQEYGVYGLPGFLIFKDGKLIGKEMGAVPEGQLTKYLR